MTSHCPNHIPQFISHAAGYATMPAITSPWCPQYLPLRRDTLSTKPCQKLQFASILCIAHNNSVSVRQQYRTRKEKMSKSSIILSGEWRGMILNLGRGVFLLVLIFTITACWYCCRLVFVNPTTAMGSYSSNEDNFLWARMDMNMRVQGNLNQGRCFYFWCDTSVDCRQHETKE